MEIEERRVLRRKIPLLEAYLRLNSSTVKSLRDQGLIDKETSRSILVSVKIKKNPCCALFFFNSTYSILIKSTSLIPVELTGCSGNFFYR